MQFEVNRKNFRETRTVDHKPADLGSDQIRLAIERFAVTTNNITYAVAGDMLDYWGFFPVNDEWGCIPVMGLATVSESANPEIAVGGRYFGFYPMATDVVITARATGDAFVDVGSHRSNHAAVYTGFRNVDSDPTFRPDQANEHLLLWGMFMTSFLIDDYLADNSFSGAQQTLITSASSKTSISLASCLARRNHDQPGTNRAVGLTSERNRAFVEGLGLYDQVITYDEVPTLDSAVASGMVDMAGSASVRGKVHTHFADNLRFSLAVGATHWEDSGDNAGLPGPTPEFFFAPGQSAKRAKDWGPAELATRIAGAFHALLDGTSAWLTVAQHTGPEGIAQVYNELLEGKADPAIGLVVSLSQSAIHDPSTAQDMT